MIGMTGKLERLCWGAEEDGRGVDDDAGLLVELKRWGCALEASCGLERRDRVVSRPLTRAIERVEEKRDIGIERADCSDLEGW
jgi:hypothetical protein